MPSPLGAPAGLWPPSGVGLIPVAPPAAQNLKPPFGKDLLTYKECWG